VFTLLVMLGIASVAGIVGSIVVSARARYPRSDGGYRLWADAVLEELEPALEVAGADR